MAHPHPGFYRLKAYPNGPIGGMYVTRNGIDEPITLAAAVPPLHERQIWDVRKSQEDLFVILMGPVGIGAGFSYHEPLAGKHIILAEPPKRFTLQQVPGHKDVYIIGLVNPLIGVDLVVGVNLTIESFLPEVPVEDRPAWEFLPAHLPE